MGISCCLNLPDCINIFGILVNAALAIWIVRVIQNKLTNNRVLKDHFINEVKEIRNEYRVCLSNLHSNKMHSKNIIPWFKLMNIKVSDFMGIINEKYNIDKDMLYPYQNTLRELVTEDENFIQQYKNNADIQFSDDSKNKFIRFQTGTKSPFLMKLL